MKPWDFEKFSPLLDEVNPKTICEIGTHKGNTAVQMIMFLAPKVETLHYTGYDVFDFASGNLDFNRREYNGKGGVPILNQKFSNPLKNIYYNLILRENLNSIQSVQKLLKKYNNNIKLIAGDTNSVLKEIDLRNIDFVFLDGGHSYDTVKFDYEQVKDSKLIIFDDAKNKNAKGVLTFMDELLSIGTKIEFQDRWGIIRNYA